MARGESRGLASGLQTERSRRLLAARQARPPEERASNSQGRCKPRPAARAEPFHEQGAKGNPVRALHRMAARQRPLMRRKRGNGKRLLAVETTGVFERSEHVLTGEFGAWLARGYRRRQTRELRV